MCFFQSFAWPNSQVTIKLELSKIINSIVIMALHGSVYDILRLQIVQMNFYINMHYAEPEDNKCNNIGSDLLLLTIRYKANNNVHTNIGIHLNDRWEVRECCIWPLSDSETFRNLIWACSYLGDRCITPVTTGLWKPRWKLQVKISGNRRFNTPVTAGLLRRNYWESCTVCFFLRYLDRL